MTFYVLLWVIAFALLLIIDMVWLMWLGRGFYVEEIGSLLLEQPNLIAAFAFYALYIAGLVYLVIAPAAEADSVMKAVISGAVFGLVAYATYDLTNLAVMKGFTLKIALIDMVWGMALSAAVSGLTVKIVSLFQTSNT
ncbi:MAG: DUF2177 family protein [Hyphomicrobiales bacterium]|nr:DUF2177 family protein [Hyphomicrobiales bacterium]